MCQVEECRSTERPSLSGVQQVREEEGRSVEMVDGGHKDRNSLSFRS